MKKYWLAVIPAGCVAVISVVLFYTFSCSTDDTWIKLIIYVLILLSWLYLTHLSYKLYIKQLKLDCEKSLEENRIKERITLAELHNPFACYLKNPTNEIQELVDETVKLKAELEKLKVELETVKLRKQVKIEQSK